MIRYILALIILAALPAQAESLPLFAHLKNADGHDAGRISFFHTPRGTRLSLELKNLPPGKHGFHIHETGSCNDGFKAAGGHYNPSGQEHGHMSEKGQHAGDLPNIHVGVAGTVQTIIFSEVLMLDERLFDSDGAAVVIHANPDDYKSQPSGAAGERIACGVIVMPTAAN